MVGLDTLENHIAQWDILKSHKSVALKFNNLKGKKRDDYYAKHKIEIGAYKSAADYFKKVMNGRTNIPVRKWEAEKKKLTAERIDLSERYYDTKDDIKVVEKLRRNAVLLMCNAIQERSMKKLHEVEI